MNRIIRTSLSLLAALLLGSGCAAPALAQSTSASRPAPTTGAAPVLTDQVVGAGRAVFHGAGTCHACHGDQLQGGPMAPALRGPKWRHIDGSYGSILQRIRQGRDGTLMVALPGGIGDPEAVQVATYIWGVSQGKVKP